MNVLGLLIVCTVVAVGLVACNWSMVESNRTLYDYKAQCLTKAWVWDSWTNSCVQPK